VVGNLAIHWAVFAVSRMPASLSLTQTEIQFNPKHWETLVVYLMYSSILMTGVLLERLIFLHSFLQLLGGKSMILGKDVSQQKYIFIAIVTVKSGIHL
jgi:hypothetical protein